MKKGHVKLLISIVLVILTATALMVPVDAIVTWHVETAATGQYFPMELEYDADGNAGFVNLEQNGSSLFHYKLSAGWASDYNDKTFGKPGLAFDKFGQPSVLYVSYISNIAQLIYAKRNSSGEWTKTTIKAVDYIDSRVSLKFNSAGYPCAAYISNGTLYYTYYNGTVWKEQAIFSTYDIACPDLSFNGTTPAIAFSANTDLKYAYLNGSKWVVETVDNGPTQGYRNRYWYINLCFGNGTPLISYFDQIASNTKFAFFAEGSWNTTILEKSMNYANPTMKVHNQDNNYVIYIAHINYVRFANTSVKLKTLTVNSKDELKSLNFSTETVFSKNIDAPPSLAMGLYNGRPGFAVSDFWGKKTYYISMQPRIQAVSSLAFGTVELGVTESRDITITNNGSLPLEIDAIMSPGAPFSITGGDPGTLAPGESRTITVHFEPTQAGVTYQDKLTIKSNDPDKADFYISLSGRTIGNNADLANIKLSNGVSLVMKTGVVEYSTVAAYATDSIRITPTADDKYAKIKVNGTVVASEGTSAAIPLSIGPNTITLDVTSEDSKEQNTYTLNITRRDSPDASLSALAVSAGQLSPEFSPEILSYTMTLPDGVSEISFAPLVTQDSSSVTINGTPVTSGSMTVPFSADIGITVYTIRVVAPDNESTMDYIIMVYRLPELSGINLNHGVLDKAFDPYDMSYTAVVPYGVTSITVTPTAATGSIVSVNGDADFSSSEIELEEGENLIPIKVLSPDMETSREYSLMVMRLEGLYALSVGDKQVMAGYNEFDLSVEIVKASAPVVFTAPEGMSVKVNNVPVTDGISPELTFSEGQNSVITIELISPECVETTIYNLTVFRRPLLTNLEIAGDVVSLWDDVFYYVYKVENDVSSVAVKAEVNEGTSISLEGNLVISRKDDSWIIDNLRVGANYAYLMLKSADGKTETQYNIIIQRPPTLESLSTSEGELSPSYNPDIYNYEVNVEKDTDSITINAEASTYSNDYPVGAVSINYEYPYSHSASQEILLSYGDNIIPVTVIRDDYVNTTYYVNVIREEPVAATLSPEAGEFYKNPERSEDIVSVITWNDATSIIDIKNGDDSIDVDNYSVTRIDEDTATLTIKKGYLESQAVGQLILTAEFDVGASAELKIEIIQIVSVNFHIDNSNIITKTINAGQSLGANWPSNPKRNGYVFAGWYTGEDDSGIQITAMTVINFDIYVYAKWTVDTTGTGGTGDIGITPTPPLTPIYDAHISGGGTLPFTVNTQTGDASLNLSSLSGGITSGTSMVINVPPIAGLLSYTAQLPALSISGSAGGSLTMNTGLGSLTIPGNMLSGTGLTGSAGITVGMADKSKLPDEVNEAVGNRPIIQLNLTVDGKQVEWNNPDAPVTVSIPYTPSEAERANPDSIVVWYINSSGEVVVIPNGHYDPVTRTVIFSTTHFSDFAVVYTPVSFNDVAKNAWYQKAVSFIAARGITKGTGNDNYSPESKLTRGEFLVLMMRAYGIEPDIEPTTNFSDAGNTYYTGYLAAAKRRAISNGVGDNKFAPEQAITRQEMFTLLYNTLKVINQLPKGDSDTTLSDFIDAADTASWAKDAMTLLVQTGIVSGSNGELKPMSTTTRAEIAQVLYNLFVR